MPSRTTMRPRTLHLAVILAAVIFCTGGCVYFNTFYLARKEFRTAETLRIRLESRGAALSREATDHYRSAVTYASKVLSSHPDSRWAPEAVFMSQAALLYLGEKTASITKGRELLSAFPESEFVPRSRYFLAVALLETGIFDEAAVQARAAAGSLTGIEGVQARLVEARAVYRSSGAEAALPLYHLSRTGDLPDSLLERSGREEAALLAESGRFRAAADSLQRLLDTLAYTSGRRFALKSDQIDYLLASGDTTRAEAEIATLEGTDEQMGGAGLVKYYRGSILRSGGNPARGMSEMRGALLTGIPPGWETRVRRSLADAAFEAGIYLTAYPEYRALARRAAGGDVAVASQRMQEITRLYVLLGMTHRFESGLYFDDPRGIRGSRAGRNVHQDSLWVAGLERADSPPGSFLYMLAEQYALGMSRPDSAAAVLDLLLANHPESPLLPRALYARALWTPGIPSDRGARPAPDRLEQEFPESEWAYYLRRSRGDSTDVPAILKARELLRDAEEHIDPLANPSEWEPALRSLRDVVRLYPGTDAARQAALESAYLLERMNAPPDSVEAAYRRVIADSPDSREARIAQVRIGASPPDEGPRTPARIREERITAEMKTWQNWLDQLQATTVRVIRPQTKARIPPVGPDASP